MAMIKVLTFFLALSVTAMVNCSLLEMSQTLWAKLVSGGLAKAGQLDPLRVPVIKVDQSEGNTSYRMVLRNVEISGLNDSILESVHVARGRLRSNLSELESGYVSYTDLRGIDSIKYRFHTLLKQPRRQGADAEVDSVSSSKEDHFERLRQYDPKFSRLRDGQVQVAEESGSAGQLGRNNQYDSQYSRTQQAYQSRQFGGSGQYDSQYSRDRDGQYQQTHQGSHSGGSGQYDSQYSRDRDGQYQQTHQGSHSGGSGQYDSQYSRDRDGQYQQTHQGSHSGGSGQYDSQYSRDRDGQYQHTHQGSQLGGSKHDSRYSQEQDSQVHEGSQFGGSRQYDSQYSRVRNEQLKQEDQRSGSVQYTSQYPMTQNQHYEQSHAGSQFKASENYDSQYSRFEVETHEPQPAIEYGAPPPPTILNHPPVTPHPHVPVHYQQTANIQYSSESPKAQYEEIQRSQYSRSQYVQNPQVPLENSRVDFHSQRVTTEYPSTTTVNSGQDQGRSKDGYKGFRAHVDPSSGSIYMRGRRIQTLPPAQRSSALKTAEEDSSVIGSRYPAGVDVIYAESPSSSERKSSRLRQDEEKKDCQDDRNRKADRFYDAEVSASENTEARVNPSRTRLENQPGYIDIVYADGKDNGTVKHFGNFRIESNRDKKMYNLDDIMKDIRTSRGLIAHNMTGGESLTSINAARKIALESGKLQDLIRYAKNYQEAEGYFEEGMQLIYHYGNQRNGERNKNEGKRTKRAHLDDDNDEDVMHIILRIRVPVLRVKSQYQLNGKVGPEILRGNGLLSGNFTELVGDFTVELKKTGDDLMIVRAARAKLVAGKKNISLEGMDDKGPVEAIFNYGLMAAEAVAAMLADDLATKALTDKSADAMIYKMYKDLPAI